MGVKQGDNLSPIIFCLYINDLALTLIENNIWVNVDGHTICILLYADDIVLLAENEKDLQTLLDITQEWCLTLISISQTTCHRSLSPLEYRQETYTEFVPF